MTIFKKVRQCVLLACLILGMVAPPLIAQPNAGAGNQSNAAAIAKIVSELPPGAVDTLVALLHDENRNFVSNPLMLIISAEQVIERDPVTALAWYYFGQFRLRYDVARCRDRTTEAVLTVAPMTARKTVAYVRNNPKAAAEGLTRALRWDEKFDGPGTAAEGMATCASGGTVPPPPDATRSPQPPWLIDRSEWPAIRKKSREAAEQAVIVLVEPAFDHPFGTKGYKVARVPFSGYATLAWFNEHILIYETRPSITSGAKPPAERLLFSWDGKTQPRRIARLIRYGWCAGMNRLLIITDVTSEGVVGDRTTTVRYRAGGLDAQQDAVFTYKSSDLTLGSMPNHLDCSYDTFKQRTVAWKPLMGSDGRLYSPSAAKSEQVTWHRPSAAPVVLPLAAGTIREECINHFPDEGYFLWPCNGDHSLWAKWSAEQCIPSVFLRPSGAIDKICLPTVEQFHFYFESVSPSRIGLIFSIQRRDHPSGDKPGGFYRLGEKGIEKMLEERVFRAVLSPDRCRIAYQTAPLRQGEQKEIGILELCDR